MLFVSGDEDVIVSEVSEVPQDAIELAFIK